MTPQRRPVPVIVAALLLLAASGRSPTTREEMKFGVEAAKQGLWREAIFRWEKLVKSEPENPHVRNNLAVAYESVGDFDRARGEYREALRLSPGAKEIRDNYASFLELCKTIRGCAAEGQEIPAPPAAPAGASAPAGAPASAPAPTATAPAPSSAAEPASSPAAAPPASDAPSPSPAP